MSESALKFSFVPQEYSSRSLFIYKSVTFVSPFNESWNIIMKRKGRAPAEHRGEKLSENYGNSFVSFPFLSFRFLFLSSSLLRSRSVRSHFSSHFSSPFCHACFLFWHAISSPLFPLSPLRKLRRNPSLVDKFHFRQREEERERERETGARPVSIMSARWENLMNKFE